MKILLSLSLIISLLLNFNLNAQSTQSLYFVNNPFSVSTFGIGEQGVASLSNDDALIYNPAKLVLTGNTKFSYYKNPYNMVIHLPLSSYTLYHNVKGLGSFAVSFQEWDQGEFHITSASDPDGSGEKYQSYERSIAVGFARNIGKNVSAGAELRYAYADYYPSSFSTIGISFGLLYNPEIWDKKLSIGFSLMNLGPAVKYEWEVSGDKQVYYDPPPTKLNLGINIKTFETDFYTIPVDISISKPFDKRDDNLDGKSSFKTILTDWNDFPNDASLHTGLSFIWKPLNLGNNFSYIQEFFTGNYSGGIKTNLRNFYNIGANIGIAYSGYTFMMGYAGVIHNVHYPHFLTWRFPYETFQFSFQVNNDLIYYRKEPENKASELDNIILSSGLGYTERTGKAKTTNMNYAQLSRENSLSYYFEAAFYFNKNSALITSLIYNPMPFTVNYNTYKIIDSKIETFSFYSSYRYHPLEKFRFLYIQGGIGIYRENLVIPSSPRYDYKAAFQISSGLHLDFLSPIIIAPDIDYNIILNRSTGEAPRIGGFNQFSFKLKAGYSIF